MTKELEYRAYAGTCVDLANKAPTIRTSSTSWLSPRRGWAWLIVFSDQFPNPTLGRCIPRFGQSLGA